MQLDMWHLYRQMLRSRLFEEVTRALWNDGLISGEMHLGTGEEAIVAGLVDHLADGDAMALDHRGTPALIMRGIDPVPLLREFLGRPDGLCSGMGGHMHLFSPDHLAASSGIVGASGPAAAGFALAALHLRPGTASVAFFGEGAMNQGMMLEAMNLAVVWQLPVLFVCKDNRWAITSRSSTLTGGDLADRARSLGLPAADVDGRLVQDVWHAAQVGLSRAHEGGGPSFLRARCVHLDGHFLGDTVLKAGRHPLKEMTRLAGPMLRSATRLKGASVRERVVNLLSIATLGRAYLDENSPADDPLGRARPLLEGNPTRLRELESAVTEEMRIAVDRALEPA
jgi:TPP-dependent pyruvate/acetoin dehydrogenase alpha subunit